MSQSSKETRKEFQRILRRLSDDDKDAMCSEMKTAAISGKNRAEWLGERKSYWASKADNYCAISTQNIYGFTDLTPFNAITGSDKISKATLTNCKQKASGSFNG